MPKQKTPTKKTFQYGKNYTGQLVYCTTNKLKSFVKNKIYKIERNNGSNLKLEGIKYSCYNWNFDFIENNPAIYREYQINQLMDIESICNEMPEKKIDSIRNRERLLTQLLINKLKSTTCVLDSPNSIEDISFEKIVYETTLSHKKLYGITEADFAFLENLTFKEVIDILK
jgi:hypothetical protein